MSTVNDITDEIPFDIPDTWKWVRLKNIARLFSGYAFKGQDLTDTKQVRVIRISDFDDNRLKNNKIVRIDENKIYDKFIIENNSILLAMTGGTVGKSILLKNIKEKMYLNQRIVSISQLYSFICIDYLDLNIQSPYIQQLINDNKNSTNDNISMNLINNFLIPLPPFNEQQQIINKIENVLPYIEKYNFVYSKLTRLNNSYKEELKKSILQYAIQGKLVQQDQNDEPADILINKILSEKRELIKSKQIKKENLSVIYKNNTDNQFYEKFDDGTIKNITDEIPFDIPDNWAWTRLNNIGTIIGGGTPKTNIKDNWENANIPWLTPADMKNIKGIYAERGQRNISEIGLKNSSAKLMPAGTILYSSRAPIGYIAIARNPVSTNQGFKSVVLVRNEINLFLYYELIQKTPEIISRASGTTFKEISGADFGKTIVTIPPMEEQERIVNKLNQVLNYIEAAE